jgi:hypothetical protein
MTVKLFYWSFAANAFKPIPGVAKQVSLGTVSGDTIQGGADFKFKPPVVLSASITFTWSLAGKVLASVTKLTGHGDKAVQQADPAGYSTATCRMPA